MAYQIENGKAWMSDWTAPNGRRLRRRHPTEVKARAEEDRQRQLYKSGLTNPTTVTLAHFIEETYLPLLDRQAVTFGSFTGPMLGWILGPKEEPTSIALTRIGDVGRQVVRDWLMEIQFTGVWSMARPVARIWKDRALLVPGEPCPCCGGPVIERPPTEGESRRGLLITAVRECPLRAMPHRGPNWREGQPSGCGAQSVRRVATVKIANRARRFLSRILNVARVEGMLVFPGGVNPSNAHSPRRLRGANGEEPLPGAARTKVAYSALSIELLRAFQPSLEDAYLLELLYYGMHRPADLGTARFDHLDLRIVSPAARTTAYQLRFERQKQRELRQDAGRSTTGLVTLPWFVAHGLVRAQELMGVEGHALVIVQAATTIADFTRSLAQAGVRSGVGHVYPYNGRLSVSCLRRRAGEDEQMIADEGDHTVEVMRKFYSEAGYDSLSFGPLLPLGELIQAARPEAEARALSALRSELARLEEAVRSRGEAVLRLKRSGASVSRVARELEVGAIRARQYLQVVTDDPMQAALVPHHPKAPPPAVRLEEIRSNIDWLERHGVAGNPYPSD